MIYELWHLDGGSMIGTWDTEEEALALVRAAIEAHGSASVAAWALLRDDPDGETVNLAKGGTLVERAQAALTAA